MDSLGKEISLLGKGKNVKSPVASLIPGTYYITIFLPWNELHNNGHCSLKTAGQLLTSASIK